MSQETIELQIDTPGEHVLDTIVLPEEKAILYTGQITSNSDVTLVNLKLIHDGAVMGKTQQGLTLSDNPPVSFDADVENWEGVLTVTVSEPSLIVLEKQVIPTTLYGENTKSGKLIRSASGCAYESEYANGSMTIREANNNQYGDPELLFDSPTPSGPEVIINGNFSNGTAGWIPRNDAVMTVSNGVATIVCNNPIKDDFYYQQFEAELGYTYIIETEGNAGRVIVGSTLEDNNYVDANIGGSVVFTPNTISNVFVTIGHTDSVVSNVFVKKWIPLHTYNQFEGTMYMKWGNTTPQNIMTVTSVEGYDYSIDVDANNDVVFSANGEPVANFGAQQGGNNFLAFSYGASGIKGCLNGGSSTANLNMEVIDNMVELAFSVPVLQFSYMPEVFSQVDLTSWTNG